MQPGTTPASILDVARRAGVSASTVSRSLRGLPHVSEPTRQRVLSAAAELSYTVSPSASRLATGRTQAVGVVVPYLTRWFFAHVVAGSEAVLRDSDLELVFYTLGDEPGRRRFFDRMPLRRRVDAVLVLCVALDADERATLTRLGVPVVCVGNVAGAREASFGNVRIDDVQGAARAVRHLVNLGHERLAMISGTVDDGLVFATPVRRRQGFEWALAAAGLPRSDEDVAAAPWGFEGGARATEQLLSSSRLPTAVFAESDEMAFGALRTLRRAGLRVPGDVSLVGFDDHEFADVVELTTVAQPVQEQGEIAATLLLEALGGRTDVPEVVVPTRLVVRGTTGPPGRPPADPAPTTPVRAEPANPVVLDAGTPAAIPLR